jgi:cytochrome c oxidase assembly protein subunit 15
MADLDKTSNLYPRAVRLWLFAAAAMIFLTLVVGGATRLTESGLSIVEWKPVTGVLPPLFENEWQAEFTKYQAIPQYRELNRDMSLKSFKAIYWWEWSHRLLARATGAVFLLPFLFFLWRGAIPHGLRARLWTIFAAGGALGAVGWWMVSSGLAGSERVSVSQYRLAFHLSLACTIYAAILWTAGQLAPLPRNDAPARLRIGALIIALLVLLQIYLGALVAGLDAGIVYNTWPLIDDSIVPSSDRLWFIQPAWRNLFENTLTVQFDHRMVAYAIWVIAGLHAIDARQARRGASGAVFLAAAVTLQVGLGVTTLLYQAPLALALAHQMLAILVFTIAVVHAGRLSHRTTSRMAHAAVAEQGA